MRLRHFLFALFLTLPLAAFAQDSGTTLPPTPSAEALAVVTKSGIDGYILGANDRLVEATRKFEAAIGAYCRAPSTNLGKNLATGFTAVLLAWAGLDFLQFGPLQRDTRLDRFAFWPDPHGTAERQLREWLGKPDPSILKPGALAAQSAAIQGLPALERLLFDGSDGLAKTGKPVRFRCDVSKAIAANLVAIAAANRADWQGDKGWRALMLAPGPDNPVYVKPPEPVIELLKALLTGIERLADQRMQPARGVGPEYAKASRAPYALSGATIAYWQASADSLMKFAEALRLRGLLPDRDLLIADFGANGFAKLKEALAGVGSSLEGALTTPEPRQKLGAAIATLHELRDIYGTQLPGAAGLTAGFNALDGD